MNYNQCVLVFIINTIILILKGKLLLQPYIIEDELQIPSQSLPILTDMEEKK